MKFIKYHAIGNDYLVYDDVAPFNLNPSEISKICHRNTGIGSDGILVYRQEEYGVFRLQIFNPDGSEAEKSGNGIRIFSRFLWDKSMVHGESFRIITAGGEVISRILEQGNTVEVSMGQALFLPNGKLEKTKLNIKNESFYANLISMGNPHCVIFQEQVDQSFTKEYGSLIERNKLFDNGTNVQFVQILDEDNIRIEIWERGAGYTLSSGSSSCAAAVASFANGFCNNNVTVHMQGGCLNISIDSDYKVKMTGPVKIIGIIDLDKLFLTN
ncbi:diaminopimelate epimerase [Klebsiella sp. DNRA6]|uniref:diaminopimelate epimerase n=1 Tax=Klebsiella sp. DNRA6 TaxID=2723057 RepID=UPI001473D7CD|nr:diaminopimelate epimerase [Klebsiella sp. DNRA6]NMD81425.1 diaminopimelate epimerase [Klebsiella sp. DNRA6]